jgi:hypothetical protein
VVAEPSEDRGKVCEDRWKCSEMRNPMVARRRAIQRRGRIDVFGLCFVGITREVVRGPGDSTD